MDPIYDFNKDGKVNLLDVAILLRVHKAYPEKITLEDVLNLVDGIYGRTVTE
jgi:hypothetical protein